MDVISFSEETMLGSTSVWIVLATDNEDKAG